MNKEYESAIDQIYLSMDNYECENIDTTLNSLIPFLIYRQTVAIKHYPFNDDIKELIIHCNNQILEILSIPKP